MTDPLHHTNPRKSMSDYGIRRTRRGLMELRDEAEAAGLPGDAQAFRLALNALDHFVVWTARNRRGEKMGAQ